MADTTQQKAKKKSFRKFSYRGVELTQLLDLKTDELVELFHARARRRYVCECEREREKEREREREKELCMCV